MLKAKLNTSKVTATDLRVIELLFKQVRNREFMFFTKHNHGLWEQLVLYKLWKKKKNLGDTESLPSIAKEYSKTLASRTNFRLSPEIMTELFEILDKGNVFGDSFKVGISGYGSPGKTGRRPITEKQYEEVIDKFVHPDFRNDGLLFKKITLSGLMLDFLSLFNDMPVLYVATYGAAKVAKLTKSKDFKHLSINHKTASQNIDMIVNEIRKFCNLHPGKDKCVLLQTGTMSTVIAAQLYHKVNRTFLFDMGRSIDMLLGEVPHGNSQWIKDDIQVKKWYDAQIRKP